MADNPNVRGILNVPAREERTDQFTVAYGMDFKR
jgi:hypothetical protein